MDLAAGTSPMRFEQVVLPHLDSAYNLARWLVADAALAEDVVQDASIRALTYFSTYRGGDGRAWFLRIVRNTAMTALSRSRPRDIPLETASCIEDDEAAAIQIADPRKNPEESYGQTQALTVLDSALARLPADLRECIVMRECEELSYREIADIVGVPIGTIMSRLWRARQSLAGAMDEGVSP